MLASSRLLQTGPAVTVVGLHPRM